MKKEAGQLMKETIERIGKLDKGIMDRAQAKLDSLTKPLGSLGRLEELAKQVVGITNNMSPKFSKKLVIVMAADHGVVDEGVSAYPREVTPQMVYNFLRGGAGINVLSRHVGAGVLVVDIGVAADLENVAKNKGIVVKKVGFGTSNMVKGPAMTRDQAIQSIETGIEVAQSMIKSGYSIIGTGDMGIGNTTASSAIASCICDVGTELVTGYGTGIDEAGFKKKVEVIKKSIRKNNPDRTDGIDVLSKIGGFEIGGIAGVILGCASGKVPVVIDGFISGAGALIAEAIAPDSRNYMIASHSSVEKGHKIVLEKLKLKPLFNFDMRLGEGTGAAIGMSITEASIKILNEMATFDEAGVSQKNE
ncbi:MAG: nicotinate-nucleotide--dimethylbenzimidazole phosphoribosyltransferase [Actinobacteria bacterium]|nr:nicotinate-nucleotide--dimethylbenzimidazole phosphoribosyltransferase [Actinomycetota bacterium]